MEEYKRLVSQLFDRKSNQLIANSSAGHAAILLGMLFKHAQEEVRIFSQKLSADVFNDSFLNECAESFLKARGKKLRIAITDDNLDESRFRNLISTIPDADVAVYRFKEIFSNGKSVNFAVMDKTAYRYEPDRTVCRAIASANDKEFAGKLAAVFDQCLPV